MGYSASFERKKQYSQSKLPIGPVGLASTWNTAGAVGGRPAGIAGPAAGSAPTGFVVNLTGCTPVIVPLGPSRVGATPTGAAPGGPRECPAYDRRADHPVAVEPAR